MTKSSVQPVKVPQAQPYINTFDLSILHRILGGESVSDIACQLGISANSVYARANTMKLKIAKKYPGQVRYETGYTNRIMLPFVEKELSSRSTAPQNRR